MHKIFDPSNIQHAKQGNVQNERAELAEFVKRQMEERNWSTYDVVRESGGLITSNSTVWNVLNQRVKDVKEKTLQGLAKAFKVSEEEVFNAYRGKTAVAGSDEAEKEEIERLYFRRRKLTPKRKAEFNRLLAMVDNFLDDLEKEEAEQKKEKASK